MRIPVRWFGLLLALAVALASGGAAARPLLHELRQAPAGATAAEIRPGELLVELRRPERAQALGRRVGAAVDGPAGAHVQRLRVPAGEEHARAAALRREPGVVAVAPNYVRRSQALPNDPLYQAQWALP